MRNLWEDKQYVSPKNSRLQWTGHVLRIPMDKLPKFALRCTPTDKRKRGSQKPPGGEQRWKSWRRWDLHGAKRRPKGEAQAKAKDRVEWRRLISTLSPTRDGEVVWVSSGGSKGGVGGPPPYFQTNLRPEGPRNFFFLRPGLPPYLKVRINAPLPYLKVWICHWWMSQ